MVGMEEFYLPSSDEKSRLHCINWAPDAGAVAVLQITHGMREHIRRYDEFARSLSKQKIAVIGHDHLGHGETSGTKDLGYFAESGGKAYLLKDIHRVGIYIRKHYPGIPYFILGHSMGSFFLRRYLTVYGHEPAGVIIMGTGNMHVLVLKTGLMVIRIIKRARGARYRSPWMHHVVLGRFNKRFEPAQTPCDWLSGDAQKVREYQRDPLCNFYFTCSAYEDFFQVMLELKRKKYCKRIPRSLPVYLISGKEDPVGSRGGGVLQVFRQFQRWGVTDVSMKLYNGNRHEILNEINRECVYSDIFCWLKAHISD